MITINPTSEAVKFHHEKVLDTFETLISNGYIKRNNKIKNICKEFITFLEKHKLELITGKPERLIEIHEEYKKKQFSKHQIELIKSFFIQTGYGSFPNKEFLNLLNIDTCLYCNRNYTLYFGGNNARAELDHWFPKGEFPILALSFYNLIPSCHSCNHIKGASKSFDWLTALDKMNHPYFDKNEFTFSYDYHSLNDFKMKINVEHIKTKETLKFNKTKEIYDAHSEKELKDLLDLRYKYSNNYLDILLNKTFSGLSMSEEEACRMIFGIEIKEEEYHKRPFSKFKHDIIKELLKQ
ncbi:HNH endonuclease [Flavobacterium geliluteum]|uniref:HNH endonuclease n=1 Tax=Flavobacterium geliluteum TaxID=2816120 RepID=A0A940XBB0_9FLAO|nr:hypothetical protein [Flavobacterium geliluteum]MBP4136484.1 hypothetical protein [Flavobacterium geliluteum]